MNINSMNNMHGSCRKSKTIYSQKLYFFYWNILSTCSLLNSSILIACKVKRIKKKCVQCYRHVPRTKEKNNSSFNNMDYFSTFMHGALYQWHVGRSRMYITNGWMHSYKNNHHSIYGLLSSNNKSTWDS